MVKDVTMFHKHHLGGGGMLECVCVCVCVCCVCVCVCVCVQGFIQDFEFFWGGGRGTLKFGVDMQGVYST